MKHKGKTPEEIIADLRAAGHQVTDHGRVRLPVLDGNHPEIPDSSKDKRNSKYGNRKVEAGGLTFDSTKEYTRWLQLSNDQDEGRIAQLKRQVPFPIFIMGYPVCDYVADFVYVRDGLQIVEDVKGFKTAMYRLKKKLVFACYGIVIKET